MYRRPNMMQQPPMPQMQYGGMPPMQQPMNNLYSQGQMQAPLQPPMLMGGGEMNYMQGGMNYMGGGMMRSYGPYAGVMRHGGENEDENEQAMAIGNGRQQMLNMPHQFTTRPF